MGQTTDFIEFTDSQTAVAPAGRLRFRLHGGVAQQSVDGGAWSTIGGGGGGGVTNVSGTAPISVANGATTPVVSIDDTAVTPGAYTSASITVDQKGRITAASSGGDGGPDEVTLALIGSTIAPFMAARDAALVKLGYWASGAQLGGDLAVGATTNSGAVYLVNNGGNNWVTRVESGTTASSTKPVRTPNATIGGGTLTFATTVPNVRTSKYGVWVRVRVNAVTATASAPIANMTDEATQDTYIGILGATSTTNFSTKIGSAAAQDTGVAFGTLGTTVHDIYWINDSTNTKSYFDGSTSAATTGASNTAANAAGHWQANASNGATSANNGFDILGVAVFIA